MPKPKKPNQPEDIGPPFKIYDLLTELRNYIWSLNDADKIRELTGPNRFLNTPPDEKDGFPPTKPENKKSEL